MVPQRRNVGSIQKNRCENLLSRSSKQCEGANHADYDRYAPGYLVCRLLLEKKNFELFILQTCINDQAGGQTKMPEDIEPPCCLGTRTEKTGWRNRAREGEHVRNNNQRSKDIAPRKRQKRA